MEILGTTYNYRNPFVAGFLPAILDSKILNGSDAEDQVDNQSHQNKKLNLNKKNKHQSMKSLHVLVTTSVQSTTTPTSTHSECLFSLKTASSNQLTSFTCLINSQLNSLSLNTTSETTALSSKQPQISKSTSAKNKKTQRNKRQRQARQAKRILRKQRHVHFPPDDCIKIVYMVEDDDNYIDCRAKYWEFFYYDRLRFSKRLKEVGENLDSVLSSSHREKIYKERFEGNEDSGIDNSSTNTDTCSDRDEEEDYEDYSDNEISLSITLSSTTTLHFYKPT